MKHTIGLVLLTLGIGLTAGFGANLSPAFRAATLAQGEATFSDATVDALQEAYCGALQANQLPPTNGCPDAPPLVDAAAADGLLTSQLRAAQAAALPSAPAAVTEAHTAYTQALKTSQARWEAVEAAGTQGPGDRLSGWLGVGGAGFGFGLLLLAAGAWLCRRAAAAGLAEPPADDGERPMDFGALLTEVSTSISGIHQDMDASKAPTTGDLEGFKERLEEIQKEAMARLCASGPRVQQRYGLQGMAAIFSPLSAAERKLNRSWAAMVDQHWPESLESIRGAVADLEATRAALDQLAA